MGPEGPLNIYLYNLFFNRDEIHIFIKLRRFLKKQKSFQKGFTLPEVLLSAAIFAFAMAGILKMYISCTFLDQTNRNKSIATIHAEYVMEDIMKYMRDHDVVALQKKIEGGEDEGPFWNWNYDTITNVQKLTALNSEAIAAAAPIYTDPLHVTITVNWEDKAQAKTRSLKLETLISER